MLLENRLEQLSRKISSPIPMIRRSITSHLSYERELTSRRKTMKKSFG